MFSVQSTVVAHGVPNMADQISPNVVETHELCHIINNVAAFNVENYHSESVYWHIGVHCCPGFQTGVVP